MMSGLDAPPTDSSDLPTAEPDPSWSKFYVVGGISAVSYVLLAVVIPYLLTLTKSEFWDSLVDGPALLQFIADNKLYWYVVQGLVLGASILAIFFFVALYLVLKHLDRVLAAIGAIVSVTAQLLFLAYFPVILGMVYLSNEYAAATVGRQSELAIAADALIAQNSAFNPIYEGLAGVGILILSVVMLKGVFPRAVAWLGLVTCVGAFVGLSLYPILGIGYFWWWLLLDAWFVAAGWRLYRVGVHTSEVAPGTPRRKEPSGHQ